MLNIMFAFIFLTRCLNFGKLFLMFAHFVDKHVKVLSFVCNWGVLLVAVFMMNLT